MHCPDESLVLARSSAFRAMSKSSNFPQVAGDRQLGFTSVMATIPSSALEKTERAVDCAESGHNKVSSHSVWFVGVSWRSAEGRGLLIFLTGIDS